MRKALTATLILAYLLLLGACAARPTPSSDEPNTSALQTDHSPTASSEAAENYETTVTDWASAETTAEATEETKPIHTVTTEATEETEPVHTVTTEATEETEPVHTAEQGTNVWIPVNGGTKYHASASCSNMKNPQEVTRSEAEAQGFTPCKKCY